MRARHTDCGDAVRWCNKCETAGPSIHSSASKPRSSRTGYVTGTRNLVLPARRSYVLTSSLYCVNAGVSPNLGYFRNNSGAPGQVARYIADRPEVDNGPSIVQRPCAPRETICGEALSHSSI